MDDQSIFAGSFYKFDVLLGINFNPITNNIWVTLNCRLRICGATTRPIVSQISDNSATEATHTPSISLGLQLEACLLPKCPPLKSWWKLVNWLDDLYQTRSRLILPDACIECNSEIREKCNICTCVCNIETGKDSYIVHKMSGTGFIDCPFL